MIILKIIAVIGCLLAIGCAVACLGLSIQIERGQVAALMEQYRQAWEEQFGDREKE